MDIKSKQERSLNMSKIKCKKTIPEMYIRKNLFSMGMRYRVNYIKVEGKPDIFFTKQNVAIFIHGCFWHRHDGCKFSYNPKSNVEFWNTKFENNKKRDTEVLKTLQEERIRVLIIWECAVKKMCRNDDYKQEQLKLIREFVYKLEGKDMQYYEIG